MNEAVGQDIRVEKDGVWRNVMSEGVGKGGKSWAVSAGPIEHRGVLISATTFAHADDSQRDGVCVARTNPATSTRYRQSHPPSTIERHRPGRARSACKTPIISAFAPHLATYARPLHAALWRYPVPARTVRHTCSKTRHLRRLQRRHV